MEVILYISLFHLLDENGHSSQIHMLFAISSYLTYYFLIGYKLIDNELH